MDDCPKPSLAAVLAGMSHAAAPLLTGLERLRSQAFFWALQPVLAPVDRTLRASTPLRDADWCAETGASIYLSARMGLPFSTSTRSLLKDDAAKPAAIPRAASLIFALAQVAQEIVSDRFATDFHGETPLDMESYRHWLFCTERRPARGRDYLLSHPLTSHIVVVVDGGFYPLTVCAQGQPLPAEVIAQGLAAIVDQAARHPTPAAERVGRWTALPREDWAVARGLLEAELLSREALARISDALFVVALDVNSAPETREEVIQLGRSGNLDNRWHDKSLQVIVFQNGKALLNIDHAGLDGAVMMRVTDEAYRRGAAITVGPVAPARVAPPRLVFQVPPRVVTSLDSFMPYLQREQANSAVAIVDALGIRKQRWTARPLSSEAVVQLAIQRAALRTLGKLPAVNTTIQLRHFRNGRTGSFFSLTPQSRDFLLGAADGTAGTARLCAAAQAHRQLIEQCRRGEGLLNYFYALLGAQPASSYVRVDTEGLHLAGGVLIRDRGYHLLMNNQVVTTNLGLCAGLEAANGADLQSNLFEVPYLIKADRITLCIKASGELLPKLQRFKSELEESLEFVARIADRYQAACAC